jgi:S-adenosylmethionine-diacylgycerolhomoserine-N-methlytransferase
MVETKTTHAALMDKVYRRQRYIYDLTRKYYLFGRDRMIRDLAVGAGSAVLEVGCGTARNLIRIARLYPDAELYGLDASAEMLRTASANVEHAGLGRRIRLVQGYAEALTPSLFGRSQPFERVLFPYSLSMIPDWRQALSAADESLADAGTLHVVDFGDLTGLGSVGAAALRGWLRLFHVEPRIEILRALEADSEAENTGMTAISLLPGRYAFLWTGRKGALKEIVNRHVAPQTQPPGNSAPRATETAALVDIPVQHPSQ